MRHQRHFGKSILWLIVTFLVLAISGTLGVSFWRDQQTPTSIDPVLTTVSRGEFVSQVLDQGSVRSSDNVEIRCEVSSRNGEIPVLAAVPEGTHVVEGDFLVQLDATGFEKELEQQKITVAKSEAAKIQAETSLATARAALREYIEGTFVEKRQTIKNEIYDAQSDIKKAQQELKQAQAVYEHSKKLHAKSFITRQSLDADQFAVEKAEIAVKKGENSLVLAQKKMEVLKTITYEKEKIKFESDIKSALVKLASEKDTLAVEKQKLADIKTMIKKCTITVPQGVTGQVVYAQESGYRGREDWTFAEGAKVRENQILLRIPDPKKMEVKALINEQSITRIAPQMPVRIQVDALSDRPLHGIVTKVNQYAESRGWMSGNIRKYAVLIRILDPPPALKPGMNASVSIQTMVREDALLAPIQTIYGVQNQRYCLMKRGENQWETVKVTIGGENSEKVWIQSGLQEGDQVVMNPAAFKDQMDLPPVVLSNKIELPREPHKKMGQPPPPSQPASTPKQKTPENGIALIQQKDTNHDGKLTKAEVGPPYADSFDSLDTDQDGFWNASEAEQSIQQLKKQSSNPAPSGEQKGQAS